MEIHNFSSCVEKHSKRNFVSPRGHVISSISFKNLGLTDTETNREKNIHTETYNHLVRQTDGQPDRQIDILIDKQKDRQTDRQTDRLRDKQTNRQSDRETNRQSVR